MIHDVKPAEHWWYIQNSLIYSSPQHPFWIDIVKHIASQEEPSEDKEPLTNPKIMMEVLRMNWEKYGKGVKIYPPENFNPFSYVTRKSPCNDLNNMTDTQLGLCIQFHASNPNSYVLQLHTQTWGKGKVEY